MLNKNIVNLCTRNLAEAGLLSAVELVVKIRILMERDYFLIVEAVEKVDFFQIKKGASPSIPPSAFEGRAFNEEREIRFFNSGSDSFQVWEVFQSEANDNYLNEIRRVSFMDRDYFLIGEWDGKRFFESRFPAARYSYPSDHFTELTSGARLSITVREYRNTNPGSKTDKGWTSYAATDVNEFLNSPILAGHRFLRVTAFSGNTQGKLGQYYADN